MPLRKGKKFVQCADAVCGSGESLVTECDRVKIFGVVIGESEGGSGISIGFTEMIFCFCGGGII